MPSTPAHRLRRAVARSFQALALAVVIVAVTGLGASRSSTPSIAVLGEVEVATTVSSVQLIDAVCITNTPARASC